MPDPESLKMNKLSSGRTAAWISPAQANDMVFDVRATGCEDIGYALLRPRSKNVPNTVAALLAAKLQPVKPTDGCWHTRCGFPTTARDVRLVLAPGVTDPASIERFVADYDAGTRAHQKLLAAVLTIKFDVDVPLHDNVDLIMFYTMMLIARQRRLSSIVVTHTPSEDLSDAPSHAHIIVLAREHRAGTGFGQLHPDLTDEDHPLWAEEWRGFKKTWESTLAR